MKIFEDLDIKLPLYLSEGAAKKLYAEIKDFPNNIHKMYWDSTEAYASQGDGLRGLPSIRLPEERIERFPVMVISNSCDIDPSNPEKSPPRIMYCPIIKLAGYEKYLASRGVSKESLEQHIKTLREQHISSKFFLPAGPGLSEDCVVFLDYVNNCDITELPAYQFGERRMFSLNLYGWYILLIKLSIHFTRMGEGMQRGFA